MDFRDSLFWDKGLEKDLPDCRLSYSNRDKKVIRRGRMEMDVVFCGGCGVESGLVPVHCPHVFFLCNGCFAKMEGLPPPGTVEISEEALYAKAASRGDQGLPRETVSSRT